MGEVRTLGRYEVVKHLASGGMAQVLLARARGIENFERYVVIKQIHGERARDKNVVKMFLDEARLAASLHHANIVQVHDIGQEDGEYFFAMEYVHGEDLRTLLTHLSSTGQMMPLGHVLTVVTAAAAALHHAHERRGADRELLGLVHRDVSPANILVGYDGNVKVVDFGIAKATHRSGETHSGTLKGKISYMSPEQCLGLQADRRSDVFSLGIVLFELVTVRRLFKAQSDYLTMGTIVAGNVPAPSEYRDDLPPELERIMMRALATDPNARYQTAEELRVALELFGVNANIRTSPTALGDFMIAQFGTRPEPWLVLDEDTTTTVTIRPIDFDGSQPGAADVEAPTGVTPAPGSPLARAAERKHRIRPATPPEGWDLDEKPTTMSGTPMAWTTRDIVPLPPPTKKGRGLGPIVLLCATAIGLLVLVWRVWPTSDSTSGPAASGQVTDPVAASAPDPASDPAPVAAPDPGSAPDPVREDPAPAAADPGPAAAPAPEPAPAAPAVSPSAFSAASAPTIPTVPNARDPEPVVTVEAPAAKSKSATKATKPATKKTEKPAQSKKSRTPTKAPPAKAPSTTEDPEYDPDSLFIKKKP